MLQLQHNHPDQGHSHVGVLDWMMLTSTSGTTANHNDNDNRMSPRLMRTHSDLETLFASSNSTTLQPHQLQQQQQHQHQHNSHSWTDNCQSDNCQTTPDDAGKYDDSDDLEVSLALGAFKPDDCVLSMEQAFGDETVSYGGGQPDTSHSHGLDFHQHRHEQQHNQQQHQHDLLHLDGNNVYHHKHTFCDNDVMQHLSDHHHQQHHEQHHHHHTHQLQQQHTHQQQLQQLIELDMHGFNLQPDDLGADDIAEMHDKHSSTGGGPLMDLEKPILNITVNETPPGGAQNATDQYFID